MTIQQITKNYNHNLSEKLIVKAKKELLWDYAWLKINKENFKCTTKLF